MRSSKSVQIVRNPREARASRVRIIRVLAQPQAAVEIPIHRARPQYDWPWPNLLRSHPTLTQPISQPWLPALDLPRPTPRSNRLPHDWLFADAPFRRSGRSGNS